MELGAVLNLTTSSKPIQWLHRATPRRTHRPYLQASAGSSGGAGGLSLSGLHLRGGEAVATAAAGLEELLELLGAHVVDHGGEGHYTKGRGEIEAAHDTGKLLLACKVYYVTCVKHVRHAIIDMLKNGFYPTTSVCFATASAGFG